MISEKITAALVLASDLHRFQRRGDKDKSPYISHIISALHIAVKCGVEDEDILAAIELHDSLEDAGILAKNTHTEEEEAYDYIRTTIHDSFGPTVLGYVLEVTDDRTLDRTARKQAQIDNAFKKSDGAKIVKLADRCANIGSMISTPHIAWTKEKSLDYLDHSWKMFQGLRGVCPKLDEFFLIVHQEAVKKYA